MCDRVRTPGCIRAILPLRPCGNSRSGDHPLCVESRQRILAMLYTIAVVLLVLWLLGLVTSYTIGGFIHVLLVIAVVVVLVRIISGRRVI